MFVLVNLQGERNYIMQVVCEATQSPSSEVQVAAFGCLVRIMHLYYDYMKFYMERALFGVSDNHFLCASCVSANHGLSIRLAHRAWDETC